MADSDYKRQVTPYEEFRVGDFKLRQVRLQVDDKGMARVLQKNAHFRKSQMEKMHYEEIDALEVMTLEGLWCVRIPSTHGMYTVILDAYRKGDEEMLDVLLQLLCNMLCVCSIPDGFYQVLVTMAGNGYLEHIGDQYTWAEKRKRYDKLLSDLKWVLDADLEGYKKGEPKDFSKKEYQEAMIADDANQLMKTQKGGLTT